MPEKQIINNRKAALVTGAGSGIGRGIAVALARRGWDVALVGRRIERLQETRRILETFGAKGFVVEADLSLLDGPRGVVERVQVELGSIALLVNNAGIMAGGNLGWLEDGEIGRAIAVNLAAPLELTRLVLTDLQERSGGVIFVGSTMSFAPMPSAAVYSASKAGIRGAAESLRYELEAIGVRVMLAVPPPTDTAMVQGMDAGAGVRWFPRKDAGWVGEKIVAAYLEGKREVIFGMDRVVRAIYAVSPSLIRTVFRWQRKRFQQMMHTKR